MVIDTYPKNSTVAAQVELGISTSPRTPQPRVRPAQEHASALFRRSSRRTVPDIDPYARGNEEERDTAGEIDSNHTATAKPIPADNGEGARVRSELARDLIRRVDQLLPLIGDVSLATHIRLFKRDLSRSHDGLKPHGAEGSFLSIVTLVESALSQLKWKQYTQPQLQSIRSVLDIGYRQVKVGFSDYETARQLLTSQQIEATPRIDLATVKWDDITDDDQD